MSESLGTASILFCGPVDTLDFKGESNSEEVGDVEYNDSDEGIIGYGAKTLVIRKSDMMPKNPKEDGWLRNNIFHTSCTIKGRVCGVIVDGGSCENHG